MCENMDVIIVCAWLLWFSRALEHGRHYCLGMDDLVFVRAGTWTLEPGRHCRLSMDALVLVCVRARTLYIHIHILDIPQL